MAIRSLEHKRRKIKRRVRRFVIKTVVKLVLMGGTVAGAAVGIKKAQSILVEGLAKLSGK